MKRIKLRTRFFLYHTGIIILILAGLILYIHKIVVSEMKAEDQEHFQLLSQTTAAQLDNFFHTMDHSAMQIAMHPEIIEIFRNIPPDNTGNYFLEYPGEAGQIRHLIHTSHIKSGSALRVMLYNEQGDFCSIFDPEPPADSSPSPMTDFAEMEAWFRNTEESVAFHVPSFSPDAARQNEASSLLPDTSAASYIASIRPIRSYTSDTFGYIEVWEPVQNLEEIFSHMGKDNYAEILAPDGSVLYTSPEKPEHPDYTPSYSTILPLEHAPYTVRFFKRPLRLEQELREFYLMLGLMVCAILTAVLSWERVMFRYLSSPLQALDRSLKSVAIDNLAVDITDENSEDILISLEQSFNSMLNQLENSMQRQITARTNEAKAQQLALQSQMNPHFFHNILSIISMEAEIDGNRKIPYICKELCDILRYTSHMGDGFSSIREECSNAESYMLLMKTRYEDLFEYTIQMEEGTGQIPIPKLILQPLCENCFQHGFKKVSPVWHISIHTWSRDHRWYIQIEDNGAGFSPEFMDEFRTFTENVKQKDIHNLLSHMAIGGLCIPNIYIRLFMIYEEDLIFEWKNLEQGASILLGGSYDD